MRNTETLRQEGDVGMGEGLQSRTRAQKHSYPSKTPEAQDTERELAGQLFVPSRRFPPSGTTRLVRRT